MCKGNKICGEWQFGVEDKVEDDPSAPLRTGVKVDPSAPLGTGVEVEGGHLGISAPMFAK